MFIHENFLLQNKTAQKLYHDYARREPIIDYHNHLAPVDIASDRQFENISELWLKGDHYKWRAMRASGINESLITGNASDRDKFMAWAKTVPQTLRNPLFHWNALELKRYFNIDEFLNETNASKIYDQINEQLNQSENRAKGLLKGQNVKVVCTTDDPIDSLIHHVNYSDSSLKMLPGFRPDKTFDIGSKTYLNYINELERVSGIAIESFEGLMHALKNRVDYFHTQGCRLSDHGLTHIANCEPEAREANNVFQTVLSGKKVNQKRINTFVATVLFELANYYHAKGWVMQLHLGPIRNNNQRLLDAVGADVGTDSIGDFPQAKGLSMILNLLDKNNSLPKTILYNLNPKDNALFASMAGNFNDGSVKGKIQWGAPWWFLDQKQGIETHLDDLSSYGLLSHFVGMLTDSRSLLSFPRHEYFRRILCNALGQDMESGLLPQDEKWIGALVSDICYHNAKNYFEFD